MSIQACRIIEVKTASHASFNLTHNEKLADFLLSKDGVHAVTQDGTGMVGIPLNILEEAIQKAKSLGISQSIIAALRQDIAFARRRDREFVDYLLY